MFRCKACLNHKGTHTCPGQSSLYLSICRSSTKGKIWKHLLRSSLPNFSCLWLRQSKLSLFLFFMHSSSMNWQKLGFTDVPLPFLPHLKPKYKTESWRQRMSSWGFVASDGCRCAGRRVKKKGTETSLLCDIMLFYGLALSESAPACEFQDFQRLPFKILLFQRNIISIKHLSMYFLVECWL